MTGSQTEAQQVMDQFDHAVRLLQSPDTSSDVHTQAFGFIDQITKSEQGWLACAERFLNGPFSYEGTKFQCLVVVEHAVKNVDMNPQEKATVRQFLMSWLNSLRQGYQEPVHIRNKMAQLLALVCAADFPDAWPTFFSDLIAIIPSGGVDFVDVYLRVLNAIHEQIADRELQHLQSPKEQLRSSAIKDAMRVHANPQISDTWFQILSTYAQKSSEVCTSCMKTMASYISWIDISLLVNDRFVPLLFEFAKNSVALRTDACFCLRAIILKGTDPNMKVNLVSELNLVQVCSHLLQNISSNDEDDFGEALAQLCASVGSELISSAKDIASAGGDPGIAISMLEACMPLECAIMGNYLDEVSEHIFPFVRDYLLFAKSGEMTAVRRDNVGTLLQTIIKKLRYDNEYDHSCKNDDDMIEFLEYRRQLEILFDNIRQLDGTLYTEVVSAFVTSVLGGIGSREIHINDVELALHIVYLMGASKQLSTSDQMNELMGLVTSGCLAMYNHQIVSLKFFEVSVRLGNFFATHQDRLVSVVQHFVGETGINSNNGHIRSRSCYWFLRLVKQHCRELLQPYTSDIINALQPLCMDTSGAYSNEDKIFIIESLGMLSTSNSVNPKSQHEHIDGLIQPLLKRFTDIGLAIHNASSAIEQEHCTLSMKHIVLMTTACSKGFTKLAQLRAAECDKIFEQALIVFVQSLGLPCDMEPVRNGIRTYLHRLITCMGEGILPIIPAALSSILDINTCQIYDLKEFIPLINQIIVKFKRQVEPMLDEVFLPIIQATFANLNQAVDHNDVDTLNELQVLKRCYYEFLNCLIANNLSGVFTSSKNSAYCDQILGSIIEGAANVEDVKGQKVCFHMLHQLTKEWFGNPERGHVGFDDLVFSHIIPSCFHTILNVDFNPEDAWTYLVLGEISDCLMRTHVVAGDAFLQFLEQRFFPSIPLALETSGAVLQVIQEKDRKRLSQCLKELSRSVERSVER